MSVASRGRALVAIDAELTRQDEKWGEQNHPDGTGDVYPLYDTRECNLDMRTAGELAKLFRITCQAHAKSGEITWKNILLEEVFEALAEADPERLREELIQVSAVAAAWVEAIDRRPK